MRGVPFLLLKDLRILKRSPLLVGLLIVYPILIAVLIGLALSKGPDKPRVAILNELPDSGQQVEVPVTGGNVKCQWKADWALRWAALGIDYEMSGKDLIDSVKL